MDNPDMAIIREYKIQSQAKNTITNVTDPSYEIRYDIHNKLEEILRTLTNKYPNLDTNHTQAVLNKYIKRKITEAQVIMVLTLLNDEMQSKKQNERHNHIFGIIDRLIVTVKKPTQGGRRKSRTLRKHKRTLRKHKRTLRKHKRNHRRTHRR
jgi:hypothetical protein